MKRTDKE